MATVNASANANLATPVRRFTLHEEIVVRLRDMILEGMLRPGQTIPELRLCDQLQISRTPLREALKVLAAEDLVTLLPNRGSVVREIIPDEIEEVFEVMEALAGLIGRLAAERITPEGLAELQALQDEPAHLQAAGDQHGNVDAHQQFHRRLAELSGNRVLANGYAGYADKIRRARYLANLPPARQADAGAAHVAIIEALAGHDGPRLAALLQAQVRDTGTAVVAALRQMPAGDS